MSDATAPAATTGAEASAETKTAPVETKAPEAEPTEEYEIDGKTVHWTKTQARTHIQKSGAVDKRLQEATEKQKKLDALLADFERDPEAALAKMGKDPAKMIEAMIERKAKLELLTPEQREKAKLEAERDALKAEKKKAEDEKKAEADKKLDEHNTKALEEQLVAAAEKHGLDHSPETLEGLCDVAIDLLDLGLVPTGDQVAQEFLRREEEQIEARDKKLLPRLKGDRLKSYLKANVSTLLKLPAAELLELLGPEGVKAIQSATLTQVPSSTVKPKPVGVPPRNGAGRWVSEAQFDSKRR